jgi:hypothetical protein
MVPARFVKAVSKQDGSNPSALRVCASRRASRAAAPLTGGGGNGETRPCGRWLRDRAYPFRAPFHYSQPLAHFDPVELQCCTQIARLNFHKPEIFRDAGPFVLHNPGLLNHHPSD